MLLMLLLRLLLRGSPLSLQSGGLVPLDLLLQLLPAGPLQPLQLLRGGGSGQPQQPLPQEVAGRQTHPSLQLQGTGGRAPSFLGPQGTDLAAEEVHPLSNFGELDSEHLGFFQGMTCLAIMQGVYDLVVLWQNMFCFIHGLLHFLVHDHELGCALVPELVPAVEQVQAVPAHPQKGFGRRAGNTAPRGAQSREVHQLPCKGKV
uniref:Putative secreted protein n=1 Tax=Ixodes ricinus TaxID=34613 RepID=A0A6B0V2A8_IXORI